MEMRLPVVRGPAGVVPYLWVVSLTRTHDQTDRFAAVFGGGRGGRTDLDPLAAAAKCGPVDITAFRGRFADGWSDDDTAEVLPQLEKLLGLKLVCLSEAFDGMWYSGWSNFYVLDDDGALRTAPEHLFGILLGGDDHAAIVDPATVGRVEYAANKHVAGPLQGRYNHVVAGACAALP